MNIGHSIVSRAIFVGIEAAVQRNARRDAKLPRMSIIGIGIDLVDCARIENSIERFGDRFLKRVFTEGEIAYSNR